MSVVRSQDGQSLHVLTDTVCIKLPASQSAHSMTVVTVDVPPGGGVPPHRHLKEEESYYMLNGSMLMQLGNDQWVIEPGDFVHVPAQMIHGYQNTSDRPVRFLAWTLGGAIDAFFVELSEKVQSLPEDLALMSEILDRYGVQMV